MSGAQTQTEYRFYTIDPDGHIPCPAQTYAFDSDDRAVKHARRVVEDSVIEVWQASRLVATIRPED